MQLFLLSMVGETAHVISAFGGQMHLCDFAKEIESCPGAPNCRGPGGTPITFPRLYDYASWETRTFVRDSLVAIFPDKQEDIRNFADPGEYGMENYYCRLLCCFIFMMAVLEDFLKTLDAVSLLLSIPTAPDTWIRYEEPPWGDKDQAKAVHNWRELDLVKFGVAGMPLYWKVANAVFVVIPKFMIWFVLAISGNYFLMETAGIVDAIMNSVALSFIISIDELAFATFTSAPVKHIMQNIEDYELFNFEAEESETDEEVIHRFCREEFGPSSYRTLFKQLSPKRLLYVLFFMVLFQMQYYLTNCDQQADGSWTSKPLYMPKDVQFNPIAFVFPLKAFGWHQASDVSWTMPEPAN